MDVKKIIITLLCIIITIQSYIIYNVYIPHQSELEVVLVEPVLENKVIEVTTKESLQELLEKHLEPAVLFFHMHGCGWCKKAEPVYHELVKKPEFKDIKFYSVDGRTLQAPMLTQQIFKQNISGYPTFFLINKHGFIDKLVGFKNPEDLENKIKEKLLSHTIQPEQTKSIQTHVVHNATSQIVEITTEQDLRTKLEHAQGPSIIFFHMTGCGWCQKAEPVYQNIAQLPEFASIQFYAANSKQVPVSQVTQEISNQKVTGFPTFFFLNEKGYLDKQIGFMKQEDFEQKIKALFHINKQNDVRIQKVSESQSASRTIKTPATEEEKKKYMQDFLRVAKEFNEIKDPKDNKYELKLNETVTSYNNMYKFSTQHPFVFTHQEAEEIRQAKEPMRQALLKKKSLKTKQH